MSSGNKRRFFDRKATPVVASDDDFDAVFGSMTEQPISAPQDIPIERIQTNPFQARAKFKDIDALAESIRTHGFTSRLRVRRAPGQPQLFQLVYGERRLRAAQAAGLTMIPCDVVDYSDQQMREIGLTENLQRSDLEPLEEARAFRTAIDEGGYSIRTLADQIGKSKGYVQGRVDLLRAPEDVQAMVDAQPDTFTAGLLIAQLPSAGQRRPLIERVISGDLDKESLRKIVRDLGAAAAVPSERLPISGHEPSSVAARSDVSVAELAPATSTSPGQRSPAAGEQRRVARHSQRVFERATQTLRAMSEQLEQVLPELQPAERQRLLDFIVQQHFPRLEHVVQRLQQRE